MHLLGSLLSMAILLCLLCVTLREVDFDTTEENGSDCQASRFYLGGGGVSSSKLAGH